MHLKHVHHQAPQVAFVVAQFVSGMVDPNTTVPVPVPVPVGFFGVCSM